MSREVHVCVGVAKAGPTSAGTTASPFLLRGSYVKHSRDHDDQNPRSSRNLLYIYIYIYIYMYLCHLHQSGPRGERCRSYCTVGTKAHMSFPSCFHVFVMCNVLSPSRPSCPPSEQLLLKRETVSPPSPSARVRAVLQKKRLFWKRGGKSLAEGRRTLRGKHRHQLHSAVSSGLEMPGKAVFGELFL